MKNWPRQKTWTDLIGPSQNGDMVDGQDIVRPTTDGSYKVLWHFESTAAATSAYEWWVRGW